MSINLVLHYVYLRCRYIDNIIANYYFFLIFSLSFSFSYTFFYYNQIFLLESLFYAKIVGPTCEMI